MNNTTESNKVIYSMIGVSKSFERKVIFKEIYLSYFYGAKIGVLVVDFQRGFIDSDLPMGGAPMVDQAVRNTVPVIEALFWP